jgi:hypothetical protein
MYRGERQGSSGSATGVCTAGVKMRSISFRVRHWRLVCQRAGVGVARSHVPVNFT